MLIFMLFTCNLRLKVYFKAQNKLHLARAVTIDHLTANEQSELFGGVFFCLVGFVFVLFFF